MSGWFVISTDWQPKSERIVSFPRVNQDFRGDPVTGFETDAENVAPPFM
jgi:hypothetical protein